jgi:GT2 family glycosyltransferase
MSDTTLLPIVDVNAFLANDVEGSRDQCIKVAEALREYGAVVIRDPRVSEEDNSREANNKILRSKESL